MKKILLLLVAVLVCSTAVAQSVGGRWAGVIGGMGLRLNLDVAQVDGRFIARLQSPDQSTMWMNVDTVSFVDNRLFFAMTSLKAMYNGHLDGDKIEGVFTQFGTKYTLDLVRVRVDAPKRPQMPQDQPYKAEEVVFENGDIALSGTLTMPEKGAKRAVVLVTGSGPTDRDESIYGHKPFLVLADYLTRRGIAVLRYDDRGTARSGGDYRSSDIYDFADDAKAAVEFLRSRGFSEVGVAGHSEGGQVVMILAADKVPDFAVIMAGPGVDGRTLMADQRTKYLRLSGVPEEVVSEIVGIWNDAQDIGLSTEYDDATKLARIKELIAGTMMAGNDESIMAFFTPENKSFIEFDPARYYPKIECPVLAVGGGKDFQVPAEVNLAAIKAGLPKATTKLYPDLNHLFQTAVTGLSDEYDQIEETFNEQVMSDIAEWINNLNTSHIETVDRAKYCGDRIKYAAVRCFTVMQRSSGRV